MFGKKQNLEFQCLEWAKLTILVFFSTIQDEASSRNEPASGRVYAAREEDKAEIGRKTPATNHYFFENAKERLHNQKLVKNLSSVSSSERCNYHRL